MITEPQTEKQANAASQRACCCGPMWRESEDARAIVDRRYASGEITKEQYEEIKCTLDAS